MTKKRDLKRLVRERQERTGESYVTARRHILAQAGGEMAASGGESTGAIPVVEMLSLTEEAAGLGMKCRVAITSTLAAEVDTTRVLERVRDALVRTEDDPATSVLRAAVFRAEVPEKSFRLSASWIDSMRRFIARAAAGIGGVSESGTMMAVAVDGRDGIILVIAHLGFRPASYPPKCMTHVPRLVLTTPEGIGSGPDRLLVPLLPLLAP